uniref:Uncharacterized protein n=1 Tax=Setaria italica TaxID=4555 RepID=K3ZZ01_SETIT
MNCRLYTKPPDRPLLILGNAERASPEKLVTKAQISIILSTINYKNAATLAATQ